MKKLKLFEKKDKTGPDPQSAKCLADIISIVQSGKEGRGLKEEQIDHIFGIWAEAHNRLRKAVEQSALRQEFEKVDRKLGKKADNEVKEDMGAMAVLLDTADKLYMMGQWEETLAKWRKGGLRGKSMASGLVKAEKQVFEQLVLDPGMPKEEKEKYIKIAEEVGCWNAISVVEDIAAEPSG